MDDQANAEHSVRLDFNLNEAERSHVLQAQAGRQQHEAWNRAGLIERHRDTFDDLARQVALNQAIACTRHNIIRATPEEIVKSARTFFDFLTGVELAGEPEQTPEQMQEIIDERRAVADEIRNTPVTGRPEPTEWR